MVDRAPDLARMALDELTRRRARAAELVRARRLPQAEAQAAIAMWAGIAAWFGAELPDELRPHEGFQLWTDHAPRAATAAQWQRQLATELRGAAEAALHRLEADPANMNQQHRTRALLALDDHLSLAAGLPPIGADETTERKAA